MKIRATHGLAHADFYAFTMAQALFAQTEHEIPACFHAFARNTPFGGAYILTAGQSEFLQWILHHWQENIANLITFLAKQKGITNNPLFQKEFLSMLETSRLTLDIDALPEGSLAFANTPIIRVFGPIWQCLLVEAYLLNTLNSQSIIATEASRLRYAVDFNNPKAPSLIIESGMRRAQDISGLSPTRAAYIGGTDATSNVAAAMEYDIPAKGTFSHAFVQHHWCNAPGNGEDDAFRNYLSCFPQDSYLLVDTYNALKGVERACKICQKGNFTLPGIRLDSGDLAYLSKKSRKILDAYGFYNTKIVASNNLNPHVIYSLRQEQQAQIDVWLIGTHLTVASEQPSLGCVYKLGQTYAKTAQNLYNSGRKVLKISDDLKKTTLPGALNLVRFINETDGIFLSDNLINAQQTDFFIDKNQQYLQNEMHCTRINASHQQKKFAKGHPLLLPIESFIQKGAQIRSIETAQQARNHAIISLKRLDDSHKRLTYPHLYITAIEASLRQQQQDLLANITLANADDFK